MPAHPLLRSAPPEATPPEATPAAPIAGLTSGTARVDGVRLHYRVGGDPDGPPVLLWHGFLATGYVWRRVAPALVDAGFAVLAPDMRGYGDSDKPAGTSGYDGRTLAHEFRALVRHLGFGGGRPLTLVAHDMGAPPALLWAADYPDEVSALLYLDEPVMLDDVLSKIITYTPEAMRKGSLWWWILPLAAGVPERLVVGHERAFLTWFYERETVTPGAIEPAAVDEYLRTFSGRDGVLGALGVYRAAFTTIEQTTRLTRHKVRVPVVTMGGARSLGALMPAWLGKVAAHVDGRVVADCGHFVPEERPDELVRQILTMGRTPAHR